MSRFEALVAEVLDAMLGTYKNNTYVFYGNDALCGFGHTGAGRLVFCSEKACYAHYITGTGNRPEGFHKWLENRHA